MRRILLSLVLIALPVLGQASVKTDALEILPARVELTPGEETQFGLRVRCSGLVLPSLLSSCTAGTLETSGRYIAPMEPGVYQIRVWATDRADMIGTAVILVLPKRLPTIERFDYLQPSQEVAWKVGGAQEVHLDPGPSGLPSEGQTQIPSDSDWITLWASNDTGSVTKVLPIPQASRESQTATALSGATSVSAKGFVATASITQEPTVIANLPWTLQVIVLAEAKSVQKLKESGYFEQPGVFVFEVGMAGGRSGTCVCYGRFATRQDAILAIGSMSQELRPTWETPYPRTVPPGL